MITTAKNKNELIAEIKLQSLLKTVCNQSFFINRTN